MRGFFFMLNLPPFAFYIWVGQYATVASSSIRSVDLYDCNITAFFSPN